MEQLINQHVENMSIISDEMNKKMMMFIKDGILGRIESLEKDKENPIWDVLKKNIEGKIDGLKESLKIINCFENIYNK